MSTWIRNLKTRLEDRPVVILHGNVRDKYIDAEGRVYENLTALLTAVAQALPLSFTELIFYDPVGHERRQNLTQSPEQRRSAAPRTDELAATTPTATPTSQRVPPSRVLANWVRQLSANDRNCFVTVFYLDKLVAYKTAYQDDERETLLWLEKVSENMTPNHRLVLVALQDTLVPIELYTNSPKTCVLPIPVPDKAGRLAYLEHRLGSNPVHLDLIADLTDGLFLRDLDNIAPAVSGQANPSTSEVRRLVNKYRIGEQEDQWGKLSIEDLDQVAKRIGKSDEQRGKFDEGGKVSDKVKAFDAVKGQDEAVKKIIDLLCLARAGLSGMASGATAKPKGVLFFAGPTGVGKTFLAKKLAKFLFSTEEAFLRFDMSEFKEEHTVSKLIGSPPGYVGYERGGLLTNAVRQRPFSVVLYDEIEKAHPKIMDIYLQLLDEGRLTDSRGQTVFFTETVIIFTSNLGCRTTDSRGNPIDERQVLDTILDESQGSEEKKRQSIRQHFVQAVENFFMFEISRPELLNRIGNNIVPFNYIHTPEVQNDIVNSHLKRIEEDFEDKYRSGGHRLVFDESVASWLVQKYGDRIRMFGGRGITNAIEEQVMIPLARAVLLIEHDGRQQVRFRVHTRDEGGIVVEGA